jgi:type II secretory ATPase GspE/PulE/Tfp pilus assembly ATPase PilB-like protein
MSARPAAGPAEERRLLGDLLLEAGLVDRAGLRRALEAQGLAGGRLGWHLIRLGTILPAPFHAFLDLHLEAMRPDLVESMRAGAATSLIPAGLAHHYGMVPIRETGDGVLELAVAHADEPHLSAAVASLTGLKVEPVICPPSLIGEALARHYPAEVEPGVLYRAIADNVLVLPACSDADDAADLGSLGTGARPVDWLRAILAAARAQGARRVDLEPCAAGLDLSFTTAAGGRRSPLRLPAGAYAGLAAFLEGLARIVARGRILPREGRFALDRDGQRSVVSVLGVPGLAGRSYTLDLRDEVVVGPSCADLAATLPALRRAVDALIDRGAGLLVLAVPGPAEWASALDVVLALAADRLPRRAARGAWSAAGSPDRDWPDADLVVDATPWREGEGGRGLAAAERQVVIATFDAPDAFVAAEAIARRLAGSGAPADGLRGIFSVRHLEALCTSCRIPWESPDLALPTLPASPFGPLWTAAGCAACRGSGRFEVMRVGEFLPIEPGDLAPPRRAARRWREAQAGRGLPTLGAAAMRAALSGCVETREVLRILLHEPH